MKKANAQLVKKLNKYNTIQCFLRYGSLSQEDIAKKTHLSRPTVADILKEIQDEKLISKSGMGEYSGGRVPTLYGIDPSGYFSIGIDFEYPEVHIGIMNFICEPVVEKYFRLSESLQVKEIIEELLSNVSTLIDEFSYPKDKIIGIGVGLPGIIDLKEGVSIEIERIPNWSNIHIKSIFEERFGIQTSISNDVHLMANFERTIRDDLPKEFIYVGIRSGIGMAAVYPEGTYSGYKGNAGFLGHMTVDIDGPECVCGRSGCLEAIAGEMSLKKSYQAITDKKLEVENNNSSVYESLIVLANNGDAVADELLMKASRYFAYGVANVMKILEIPTIVFYAWPSENSEKYIIYLQEQLKVQLFDNLSDEVQLIFSKADSTMGIKACSYSVYKDFIERKYAL